MIETPLTSVIDALLLCSFNAVSLALTNEPSFHLSHHPKHRKYNVPHLTSRGNMGVENRNKGLLLLTFMDKIEDISRVSSESVEARHNQLVAFAQKLQDRRKFQASLSAASRNLLRTDDGAALGLELR
jgi:hypothetical protein